MWEFNLICEPADTKYLSYIKNNLNNCESISIVDNVISIKISSENKQKVCKQLKNIIAEITVLIYKEKFFKTSLNLKSLSKEFSEALIKCLVMFDYEDDVYYVFSKLNLEYNLNLESFYIFMLKDLRDKWNDIKNVASNEINLSSETIIELIKFLVDSIAPKRKLISIYFNGETFLLKDENNMVIKLNTALSKSNQEINLITTLISLSPRVINLHCVSSVSENTFKVLYYIFNKKINLLV